MRTTVTLDEDVAVKLCDEACRVPSRSFHVLARDLSRRLCAEGLFAALAIGHGATLLSTGRDVRRFPVLNRINPLE